MKIFRTSAIAVGAATPALALALAMAPSAGASTQLVPHNSTAACQTQPGCNEPVVAVSQDGNDFIQSHDAALTVFPDNTVGTRIRNGLDNGTQDFTFSFVETVPASGPGSYGFTTFDNNHYAGQPVVQEEWTPFAQDTGQCVNIGHTSHLASLQPCGTGKGQAFILTTNVPTLNPPGAPGYRYIVSVRQANNLARHQLLTADDTGFGRVFVTGGVRHSPGVATNQMWSALP